MLVVLLLTLASGWFLSNAVTAQVWTRPRWAFYLGDAALAFLFGPGLASILYFALVIAHAATPGATYGVLGVLCAASIARWWIRPRAQAPKAEESNGRFPWTWALLAALVLAAAFLILDFRAATQANPDGEWDASAIWNLRARYLASGPDTWRRAISPSLGGGMVGSSHPGYPLFLSAFIAMQWTVMGGFDSIVPATASLWIALSVVALLVASLAARRSVSLGLLAGLLLMSTELFAAQTASQYSDLLEGLAFLAALVCLDAGSLWMLFAAGVAIGLAPWIKNEGWPFAIAALAVVVWRRRFSALFTLAGVVPGFAATAALKLLSSGHESMFPATAGEALAKLADPSRWWQAFLGFGKALVEAGTPWAHPVLLAAALAIVLRFIPKEERRARWWLAVPIGVTLAAEYGLYLITTANIDWHISTSATRLLAQIWPSLLWLLFSTLRTPEEYFQPKEPVLVGVPARLSPLGPKHRTATARKRAKQS